MFGASLIVRASSELIAAVYRMFTGQTMAFHQAKTESEARAWIAARRQRK